jgi:DNA-binding FadR family transcriptional regulator
MAALYGVSVPTVHAAIHAVETLGLVRVRHGIGTFIDRPRSSAAVANHAWLQASSRELAFMRSAIETHAATAAATLVHSADAKLLPLPLRDLPFLASERMGARYSAPEDHLAADMAFHRAMLAAVPDGVMLASLHRSLQHQLERRLLSIASAHRDDRRLDDAHAQLATAILDGRTRDAARLARSIAERELIPSNDPLG